MTKFQNGDRVTVVDPRGKVVPALVGRTGTVYWDGSYDPEWRYPVKMVLDDTQLTYGFDTDELEALA